MSEKEKTEHVEPPVKLWLFEQRDDEWLSWTGTEQELNEFLQGTDIKAHEYALTGKKING